ncbi:MAG: FHA domain-containing protein [Mariprofundaceae bacterium]
MSCKIVMKFKDSVLSEYPLEQEETVIGRKPDNEIPVDNLAVSGRHARIIRIGNKSILEDLGSTNGTFVNDKQVTKHVLAHGDDIMIGKHILAFVDEDNSVGPVEEPSEESDMDKTMILSPEARAELLQQSGGKPEANVMPLAGLQILSGPLAGKNITLSTSLTSLGKGDNCKIKVKGLTVGKQAAVITRRPTGYHIAHLEGMAKPKVNGESVADQPRTLNDGDMIVLGDTKIEFYIKEGS